MDNAARWTTIFAAVLCICATGCGGKSPAIGQPYPGPGVRESNTVQAQLPSATRTRRPIEAISPVKEIPQATPGKASLSGTLYSLTILDVIPKTLFYLTKATGADNQQLPAAFIGPEPSQGDIAGRSDEYGNFILENIPPGNYFLVVSGPMSWSVAVISETDFTPRLIVLAPSREYPLGPLLASWP
jgi:hypothetical protein